MLLAARQNFGREHAVDLEKLELDRVAAGIGGGIDKGKRAGKVAPVIAGGFGDEEAAFSAHASNRFHLP